MGHYRCTKCDAVATGETRTCTHCRACAVCWHPSAEDIEAGCLVAQAAWTPHDWKKRRREPEFGVEILDLYRGYRRVDRREYYGGH